MVPGIIVEYIDSQKIVCGLVLEVKNQRLRVLTENNREVKLSVNRLSHKSRQGLTVSQTRDKQAEALKEKARLRKSLSEEINVRELWEILNTEQEWIDLSTMTGLCFPDDPSDDHESAVIRAFFKNRLYFRFNQDQFFPYTQEQVAHSLSQAEESTRRTRVIEKGGEWLNGIIKDPQAFSGSGLSDEEQEFADILESYYLFENDSPHHDLAGAMLAKAGITDIESLFNVFVRLKRWDPDENIDIHRYEVPTDFSETLLNGMASVIQSQGSWANHGRRDISDLRIITIDGQATLDFDDALSVQKNGQYYTLGIHIADVGHYVEQGGGIDREAIVRGSSIYLPDRKIPMLPTDLAEGHCSLKQGEVRPAITTQVRLNLSADIVDYEIFPSLIRVSDQLTYYDVNMIAETDPDLLIMHHIARKFRQKRLDSGAVHITLPEVNVWIDESGELVVNRINRETPGRLLVSEIMIMANWLMARFLRDNHLPAIYRSQPDPKGRLYMSDGGTLVQNWMQRKLLSRFVLSSEPERHSGLGLDAYLTATSPIRKYSDLITQRQIRSVFGMNPPYTPGEVQKNIQALEQPMSYIPKIQNRRRRYWLLKYLERKTGKKEDALVLDRRKNTYLVLLTEYMMECMLPISGNPRLKPEDLIQLTIQHVNARKDILSVYLG
jgi:exoribonuclease-2